MQEITIAQILDFVRAKRKALIVTVVIWAILGLIIGFSMPNQYKASTTLLPEGNEMDGSLLDKFGSIAGLGNLKLDDNGISPELYEKFVYNYPFLDTLSRSPLTYAPYQSYASFYYDGGYKSSLTEKIFKGISQLINSIRSIFSNLEPVEQSQLGQEVVYYNRERIELLENLRDHITVEVSEIDGSVSLAIESTDPILSSELLEITVNVLHQKLYEYKTKKLVKNLEYIQKTFEISKERHDISQRELALFVDQNRNISSQLFQVRLNKLEYEAELAYEIYRSVSSEIEQIKMSILRQSVQFSKISPIVVPVEKSGPRRLFILVGLVILGLTLFAAVAYLKHVYLEMKKTFQDV